MTSVFDTHPPLIFVIISYVKEIRFWNQYPPTFYDNVLKNSLFRVSLILEYECYYGVSNTKIYRSECGFSVSWLH